MADGHMTGQFLQHRFMKNVGNQPHALLNEKLLSISRHYPGRLLSTMLKRVQPQIGQIRGLFVTVDAEDRTLVVKLIGSMIGNSLFIASRRDRTN